MQGRMHIYILIALVLELLIGMTNFIASYQPAFVTVLAAILNWAGGRFSLAKLFAAATVLFVFFWTSLIWTAIKPEFRRWLFEADPAVTASWTQRSNWILDRLGEELDLQKAGVKLADRIGYTQLYALAIPLLDVTEGRRSNYLLGAVEEVLMPRVLFPDKPILNDTKITMELTGLQFNKSTSVSIGYVAEATADFGFYGMLLELFAIGWVLGFFAMRLTKADIRPLEQQAFITAALAYKFFYQLNIDKSIATFSLQAIALVLFLKYCYGGFERWLIVPSRRSTKSAKASKQLARL
jgi:hypothetical protein